MAKIKAIIFDLNGVFLTSDFFSQRIEDKLGINKDFFYQELKKVLDVARIPGRTSSDIWQPLADLVHLSIPEFLDFWFSGEKLNLEMIALAKDLKNKGYKIYVLSNSLKERVEYYRQHFPEIFDLFDNIYFSTETGFVKPDPKCFENILTKNKLQKTDCLFIDDSPGHVEAAINFGIRSTLFENLSQTKEFIENNK
jgi:HAD superfamily hydrolase (TIGR01509 family)